MAEIEKSWVKLSLITMGRRYSTIWTSSSEITRQLEAVVRQPRRAATDCLQRSDLGA
jgi:hypothetical protein